MNNPDRFNLISDMLKKEPSDSFLNYALAIELHAKGNLNKAIRQLEKLMKRDENYLGTYYQLGKFYEQNNQPDKAIETYKKGIAKAQEQKNNKAQGELNEALWLIDEEQ